MYLDLGEWIYIIASATLSSSRSRNRRARKRGGVGRPTDPRYWIPRRYTERRHKGWRDSRKRAHRARTPPERGGLPLFVVHSPNPRRLSLARSIGFPLGSAGSRRAARLFELLRPAYRSAKRDATRRGATALLPVSGVCYQKRVAISKYFSVSRGRSICISISQKTIANFVELSRQK